jgi:uncharacterized protein (DUF4415 family)
MPANSGPSPKTESGGSPPERAIISDTACLIGLTNKKMRHRTKTGTKLLPPDRIAEIKAFKNTDFSDCPVLTEEELKKMRPKHPEYFKPVKKAVQIRLDADVLAWFKAYGKGYQSRINATLREVMLRNTEGGNRIG